MRGRDLGGLQDLPPNEGWLADLLVFGGFAVGLIVPPVAILWMVFA